MPAVQLPLGNVHYQEAGQGTPLVLLHANPGDCRDFAAVMPALAKNFRVLTLDWPGYGRSSLTKDPATVTVEDIYQTLRAFLDALALGPAVFIGNSVGGNAAARLAIESPERVRALVLVSPGGFTQHNVITRTFCRLQGSRFSLSPRRFAGLYLKKRTPTTEAMLERAATVQREPIPQALNRALWRSFLEPAHDLRERAAQLKVPTLLVFGAKDPAIPAKTDGKVAARLLPNARIEILDCGHASFAEVPAPFLAVVEPFTHLFCES